MVTWCQCLEGARSARVYAQRARRTYRRCDRAVSSAKQRNPWAITSAVNWSRSRRAGPRHCPSTRALGLSQARAVAGCRAGPRPQPRVPPARSPNIRVTRILVHSAIRRCKQSLDCRPTNPRGRRHRHRRHASRARSAARPCVVERRSLRATYAARGRQAPPSDRRITRA